MRQSLAKTMAVGALALALMTVACGESPVAEAFPKLEREEDGTCSIPESEIRSGGVPIDGIPAMSDPELVSADDPSATYVRTWDRVIGIEVDGMYIAVPHNILWWHEIVNFNAFSAPLAVTYCPLTGSSMVFDRTAAGGAGFGVSGLLFRNNLILYDRSDEQSLWPQMMRGARCGPRDGQMLDMVPSIEMRWDAWVELHPDTKVISIPSSLNRNYQQYPYGDYESLNNTRTLFPQGDFDGRRPPKERVLGIPYSNGSGMAFPFTTLDSGGDRFVVHSQAEGEDIVVFWDHDSKAAVAFEATLDGQVLEFELEEGRYVDVQTGSEWTLDGRAISGGFEGQELVQVADAYVSFWFAWAAFVPSTGLWLAQKPVPDVTE
jgi:hypothetical protein